MNYAMHDIIRQRIGKEETTRENTRLIYFLQEELTYFIHLLHISNTCGVCSDGIILITEHPEINTKTNINKIQVIKPVNVLININAMNFYNCASQRERSLMGISIH